MLRDSEEHARIDLRFDLTVALIENLAEVVEFSWKGRPTSRALLLLSRDAARCDLRWPGLRSRSGPVAVIQQLNPSSPPANAATTNKGVHMTVEHDILDPSLADGDPSHPMGRPADARARSDT